MVSIKRLLGLKEKMHEAREINEKSIERLEEEKKERRELDARFEAMELELDVITRGAYPHEEKRG